MVHLVAAAERDEGQEVIYALAERKGAFHPVQFEHRAAPAFLFRRLVYPSEEYEEARFWK
ncbi:hypothetical protein SDC9_166737 [bioreactor metagenome]|uniref:Uncharacterized protein n=1 Tax=bioreactor metagenome TaxID=1076179 RepID=A0A645FXU8_9ZZZZ